MSEKEKYKLEKKRIKADLKLQKNRLKAGEKTGDFNNNEFQQSSSTQSISQQKDTPWYKNPAWIRAIAAIITLTIMIIGMILTYRN